MEISFLKRQETTAFYIGLGLRLLLVCLFIPITYADWFLPYLTFSASGNIFQYWNEFLAASGPSNAFPYGPLYLLIFKPLTFIGHLLGGANGASIGLGLTVLILDVLLLAAIRSLMPKIKKYWAVYLYWLLPITIYVNYWHGQLDVLPMLLLFTSFIMLSKHRHLWSGIALGAAISAKFVMAVALPFFVIFLFQDRRLRADLFKFMGGAALANLVTIPFALTDGFKQMVFQTPESEKLFELKYSYGEGLELYFVPAALILMAYLAWRLRRYSFNGLITLIGISLFILVLLTPSSPGWALWLVPFIALHGALWEQRSFLLIAGFSVAITLFHFLHASGSATVIGQPITMPFDMQGQASSILMSVVVLSGLILVIQLWRLNIIETAFHKVTREPVLISIAGDSGAGKDTLSDSLVGLLGPEITVTVSGDDYHSYDRKKPIWRAVTHLDPLANDLHKYESDILALMTRSSIKARHYDHITGKMTKPGIFGARDFIISSGLHALYLPNLVNRSKLSVFLDMDEGLRRALKMRRDVDIRGHSQKAVEAALAKREPDSEKFIRPQKSKADLILRLFKSQNEIALETIFSPGINTAKIEKLLVSLGDHDVRPGMLPDNRISLIVYGSASAETISKLAHTIAPNMLKMMRRTPLWRDGAIGLSQLFVMFELEQKLFNGTT